MFKIVSNNIISAISIFTNPSARAGYDTRSVFKRSLTGLNSEYSFSYTSCLTKAEEPSLPYYLPIAGGRIIGFIPFSRVLELCEMQSASTRIWTRIAMSISYDDNHYTTDTFISVISIERQIWYRHIDIYSEFFFCVLYFSFHTVKIPCLRQNNSNGNVIFFKYLQLI